MEWVIREIIINEEMEHIKQQQRDDCGFIEWERLHRSSNSLTPSCSYEGEIENPASKQQLMQHSEYHCDFLVLRFITLCLLFTYYIHILYTIIITFSILCLLLTSWLKIEHEVWKWSFRTVAEDATPGGKNETVTEDWKRGGKMKLKRWKTEAFDREEEENIKDVVCPTNVKFEGQSWRVSATLRVDYSEYDRDDSRHGYE